MRRVSRCRMYPTADQHNQRMQSLRSLRHRNPHSCAAKMQPSTRIQSTFTWSRKARPSSLTIHFRLDMLFPKCSSALFLHQSCRDYDRTEVCEWLDTSFVSLFTPIRVRIGRVGLLHGSEGEIFAVIHLRMQTQRKQQPRRRCCLPSKGDEELSLRSGLHLLSGSLPFFCY